MNIKWLRTFITAAKYENFRKASEELYLTQPAVTKHIKRLESELNIELFKREGKYISLTPAGSTFQSIAIEILQKYEGGIEAFESWKQGYNQKLTIAVAPQIASSQLPALLRRFMEDEPNIEITINIVKSYEIGREVSSGKADIGLSRMEPIERGIFYEIIHSDPVRLIAPLTKSARSFKESDVLKQYKLLINNHPAYWEDLLNEVKHHYPNVKTLPVTQIEITKRFIEYGLGVSYLPHSMVQAELADKKMVTIKADKIIPPSSFTYLIMKVKTLEVEKFMEVLKMVKDE